MAWTRIVFKSVDPSLELLVPSSHSGLKWTIIAKYLKHFLDLILGLCIPSFVSHALYIHPIPTLFRFTIAQSRKTYRVTYLSIQDQFKALIENKFNKNHT